MELNRWYPEAHMSWICSAKNFTSALISKWAEKVTNSSLLVMHQRAIYNLTDMVYDQRRPDVLFSRKVDRRIRTCIMEKWDASVVCWWTAWCENWQSMWTWRVAKALQISHFRLWQPEIHEWQLQQIELKVTGSLVRITNSDRDKSDKSKPTITATD